MTTYAIGDIQGCFQSLLQLLDLISFNPQNDTLWFTGDLVNRGPQSLEVLRFVKNLEDKAISVLGNHDLHLLAIAAGCKKHHDKDTLAPVMEANDAATLLHWLRHRPLLHHDPVLNYTLVHAGIVPQWTLANALSYASEVEHCLRSDDYLKFFKNMYGNLPDIWNDELQGMERLRFITNVFTRMRFCDVDGRLFLKYKSSPGNQPEQLFPWFALKNRQTRTNNIVFGHWSTLGYQQSNHTICIDTGCLWGKSLTAIALDDSHECYRIKCQQYSPINDA